MTNSPKTYAEALAKKKKALRQNYWSNVPLSGVIDVNKPLLAGALSGSFDVNKPLLTEMVVNNSSEGFTMAQTAKIKLPDPNWGVEIDEFMVDDLKNYPNPHLQSLLVDVREIIPDKLYDQVFIAGGFASYLAGITNTHGDVDLFCVTEESFLFLYNLIVQDTPNFIVRALPIDNIGAFYQKVLKFTYQNINYDLIDSSSFLTHKKAMSPQHAGYMAINARHSLCHLLKMFDINWAMAGINLVNDTIVCHPCALMTKPFMNVQHSPRLNASNIPRVEKYASRLVREVDVAATKAVVTALGFMSAKPDWSLS